jgi:UDP-N-acetylglucosamine-lysosomal-enzyme
MVGNNATNVEKALDGIREKRQKFVCLNDNMNHSDPNSLQVLFCCGSIVIFVKVVKVLKDFYESLYPLPSSFELPSGTVNEFLHLDEIVVKV